MFSICECHFSDYTDHFLDEVEHLANAASARSSGPATANQNPANNQMLISSDRNRLVLDENEHSTHFNQWHHVTAQIGTNDTSQTTGHKLSGMVEHMTSNPAQATLPLIDMHTVENVLKQ